MVIKNTKKIDEKVISEFERFSHPLLSRLSYEAPGTFHHSVNVSILAQKAAKTIDADSLLVRVAAYFHDIGKLEDPLLFIENQSTKEIPSIEDAAYIRSMSKKIIDHVRFGLELSRENHLPQEILDLIEQSHGTTRVLYFFDRAKENKLKIKKTDLSYPGPLPRSREALILMFADSIEAATRAIPNLSPQKIDEIVENIIDEKIRDGQVKKSILLEGDLEKIKSSFVQTLNSIYHQRIMS